MQIQTIINRFPRYQGFHVFDIDKELFVSAKRLRDMTNDYHKHFFDCTPELNSDDFKNMSSEEKFDFFRQEFLEQSDFKVIPLPFTAFGICLDSKEYISKLNEVLK